MTEAEAKTKWCPMVRYSVFDYESRSEVIATNRQKDNVDGNCIGSACMMWRWHLGDDPESRSKGGICLPPTGYCGLAGKP